MTTDFNDRHTDWYWPFCYVKRGWNAVQDKRRPHLITGSVNEDIDIPKPGWVLCHALHVRWWFMIYFAVTFKNNWHFRFGTFRFDYAEGYYTWPTFTIKRLK